MRPVPSWLPDKIKGFEGLHDGDPRTTILEPKRDPRGYWTVGWGHLVSKDLDAPAPPPITMEQANVYLDGDIRHASRSVLGLVRVPIEDHQYAALTDFVYNAGAGNLEISTLLRHINRHEWDDIPYQFSRWIYSGVVKYPGLVKRRAAEARWWQGDYE